MGKYYALAGRRRCPSPPRGKHYKPQDRQIGCRPIRVWLRWRLQTRSIRWLDLVDRRKADWKLRTVRVAARCVGGHTLDLENSIKIPLVDVFIAADIEIFLDMKGSKARQQETILARLQEEGTFQGQNAIVSATMVDKRFWPVGKEELKQRKIAYSPSRFLVDRLEVQFPRNWRAHDSSSCIFYSA